MTISEIERLINEIYADVGIKYKDIFQKHYCRVPLYSTYRMAWRYGACF